MWRFVLPVCIGLSTSACANFDLDRATHLSSFGCGTYDVTIANYRECAKLASEYDKNKALDLSRDEASIAERNQRANYQSVLQQWHSIVEKIEAERATRLKTPVLSMIAPKYCWFEKNRVEASIVFAFDVRSNRTVDVTTISFWARTSLPDPYGGFSLKNVPSALLEQHQYSLQWLNDRHLELLGPQNASVKFDFLRDEFGEVKASASNLRLSAC